LKNVWASTAALEWWTAFKFHLITSLTGIYLYIHQWKHENNCTLCGADGTKHVCEVH